MDEEKLQLEFYDIHGGRDIIKCIQCGTCSGSCPLTDQMDHAPRELFALIRDGFMKDALKSDTQWYCVSCYQCMVRCPQEIPVTDMMYALKQMSVKYGLLSKSRKMIDLYKAFSDEVKKTGRMTETMMMARYSIKHPLEMTSKALLGLRLLKRSRLDIHPQKTKDPELVRRLMDEKPERKTAK